MNLFGAMLPCAMWPLYEREGFLPCFPSLARCEGDFLAGPPHFTKGRERKKASTMTQLDPQKQLALDLLTHADSIFINRSLLKNFGPTKSIWITFMVEQYTHHLSNNTLYQDSFTCTKQDQMESTRIPEETIRKCKQELKNLRIIRTFNDGQPIKEYYNIDFERLNHYMENDPKEDLINSQKQHKKQTTHWKKIRRKALKIAKHNCQICGSKEALCVHHTSYQNYGCEEITDVTVLCHNCHQEHHGKGDNGTNQ